MCLQIKNKETTKFRIKAIVDSDWNVIKKPNNNSYINPACPKTRLSDLTSYQETSDSPTSWETPL